MKTPVSRRWTGAVLSCSLLVSIAAGCGGGGVKLALLNSQASADLGCPAEQIGHRSLKFYVERIDACGKESVYFFDHSEERWISPLARASFDLGCPPEQLTTQVLDNRSVGVSGCDKKAVYVLVGTRAPVVGGFQYSWIANTVSSDSKE